MINKIIKLLFIQQIFINYVYSHSWITCTDYQLPDNYPKQINNNTINLPSISYNIDKCNGFARNYNLQYQSDINKGFGFDTGYEYRSQQCKYSYSDTNIKTASYKSGSTICLTYPSKNHVASECTNKYIPDNGVKIYRSINKQSDDFANKIDHLNNNHKSNTIDYQGFQNCPGFCNNPDKTVCYMCFNLETNIPNGIYSFKWVWEFNTGEFYSSCWDANIVNDSNIVNDPCESRKLQSNNFKYSKNKICVNISDNKNVQPTNTPAIQLTNTPAIQLTNTPAIQPTNKKCNIVNNNNNQPNNNNNNNQPNNNNNNNNQPNNNNNNNNNQPNNNNNNNNNNQPNDFANIWDQCGGNNFGNKQCKNSECIKFSPYYSQCLPNILEEKSLCGQNDNKEINWLYDKCKSGYKCKKYNSIDYRCI